MCRLDSDGDGQTNGEELGDPDCSWTTGSTPSRSNDLSHPGTCDISQSVHCSEFLSLVFLSLSLSRFLNCTYCAL